MFGAFDYHSSACNIEIMKTTSATSLVNLMAQDLIVQSRNRGAAFSAVALICLTVGIASIFLGLFVGERGLVNGSLNGYLVVALLSAGIVVICLTHSMWCYGIWSRNLVVVIVGCILWVTGRMLQARFGSSVYAVLPAVVFAALAISCFTSANVRRLFENEKAAASKG